MSQLKLLDKEEVEGVKHKEKIKEIKGKGGNGESIGGIFVIHEHHARRLHYDLRLEIGGVLKSWAVPKEPPVDVGIKRLAIQVDDHDLEYANFEGVIPEGMYGAGTVKIWDKGEFTLESRTSGKYVFELKGKKMIGKYVLVRYKDNWLFFKKR